MKVQPTNPVSLLAAALGVGSLAVCLLATVGCGHESVASQNANAPPLAEASAEAVASRPKLEQPAVEKPSLAEQPSAIETQEPESQRQPVQQVAAPAAARKPVKGKTPPADRTPDKPGGPEKILFEDLNLQMREDMVYRPFLLTDRVKELDGQKISIVGFIHAGATGKGIKEFVLLKNTECKFGPGGQADHLAMVYLDEGETTQFQLDALKVEGTLKVEPFTGPDGNTWSVYRIEDAKVEPAR